MPSKHDKDFLLGRNAAFDKVIAEIERRLQPATPALVLRPEERSRDNLRTNAEKDAWILFLNGIRHLKDGAPGGQPGAMAEALARASLRASPLAAALGVKPPQFEKMLFSVDYTDGREAALFLCQRLVEAAAADFPKSRQIIQQKILFEKPDAEILKEEMALVFGLLVDAYVGNCGALKTILENL